MEEVLDAGQKRIVSFFDQVKVAEIAPEELQCIDPQERSFRNINTPEEYFLLRSKGGNAKLGPPLPQEHQG